MRSWESCICLLFIVGLVFAAAADLKLPEPSGYINDFAGVLSSSELQQLKQIAQGLKRESGAELAVVTVSSAAPLDAKMYAVKLFEKWGIGEKGKDNGVLLLLAMKERRVEIEVGYGLEGDLTDAKCGRILDTYAVPYFKQGKMGQGLVATAQALAKVMAGGDVALVPDVADETQIDDYIGMIYFTIMFAGGLPFIIILSLSLARPWMILTALAGLLVGWFIFGWLGSMVCGVLGMMLGWFTPKVKVSSGGGGHWGGSSSSGWSSGSSSSSSGWRSGGSSSSSFGGGSSGGGGAGRSW